jgi:hypothetical protein
MSSTPQLLQSQLHSADQYQWKTWLRQALVDLRVAIPAIVKSFDPDRQVVSVQIAVSELVKPPYIDSNGDVQNTPGWVAISPINNVPVMCQRGGGFSVTLPLKQGDEGMLIFCDSCIDLWWMSGGQQPPPGGSLIQNNFERRRHDLTDCGFYPGLWNQTRVLPNYSTNSLQIRSDDGTTFIEVKLGIVNVVARGGINLQGPVNITGNLNVDGDITNTGDIEADGEVTGNDVELSNHEHPVTTAPGETGTPS